MILYLIAVAVATALFLLKSYLDKRNKYWAERGIPHLKPKLLFGNSIDLVLRKKSFHDMHREIYSKFPNEPIYGIYDFMKPYLMVKDLELIERVLIKDFQHFTDHGFGNIDEVANPVDVNLFNMQGKKWKAMRNKFSPLFTTGKLRYMTPEIRNVSEGLIKAFNKNLESVDVRDYLQRFTIDVIASVAFGLNVGALEEEDESDFRRMAKKAFDFDYKQFMRFFMHSCFPAAAKKLRIPQNNPEVSKYFGSVIKNTLTQRKASGMTRNDFVQLFITLQQKGSIEFEGDADDEYLKIDETIASGEKKMEHYELTDDVMSGQAFVFLAAGFEATANSMLFLSYEFGQNPDIQQRAYEEAAQVVSDRGVLDYDSIKSLTYLDQCVRESLRLHGFIPTLFRQCTKDYTFPGTSISLKAGDALLIPVAGIHYDPVLYPEPGKFKPERFAPGVTRPACSWLPFGDGPRICIAMRFALTEVKLAMARILLEYKIEISSKTKLPLEKDPKSFANAPKTPLYLNLIKRE